MAALSLTSVTVDGGTVLDDHTTAAAAGGDTAPTGPGRFLYVKNGSGSSITVTVATPGEISGLAIADPTISIGAGKAGTIPLSRLFAGADGRAAVTYSAVTTVTVGAFEFD
ncbi:hypothetical protein [Streptomyces sp. NPDC051014]|uniref:hypothetical protein n=1 Tax=Streptomyces sp. NPDC051014 TaxID=3155751 RepID=UPI00340C795F